MSTAKITSKGQITVPKAVREALNVGPGDRLIFHIRPDGRVEVDSPTLDLRSLVGSVRTSVHGVTIEQMDPGTAYDVADERAGGAGGAAAA